MMQWCASRLWMRWASWVPKHPWRCRESPISCRRTASPSATQLSRCSGSWHCLCRTRQSYLQLLSFRSFRISSLRLKMTIGVFALQVLRLFATYWRTLAASCALRWLASVCQVWSLHLQTRTKMCAQRSSLALVPLGKRPPRQLRSWPVSLPTLTGTCALQRCTRCRGSVDLSRVQKETSPNCWLTSIGACGKLRQQLLARWES
mmetsp:Transcript_16680/g.29732  ORF Transcript_16680/g.29732 Transcript_16680/m.29732 type:complete len:204 (-) Transcript_16680:500-1111(-)